MVCFLPIPRLVFRCGPSIELFRVQLVRKGGRGRGEKDGIRKERKEKIPAGALAHKPCCHTITECHCVGSKDRKEMEVLKMGKGVLFQDGSLMNWD